MCHNCEHRQSISDHMFTREIVRVINPQNGYEFEGIITGIQESPSFRLECTDGRIINLPISFRVVPIGSNNKPSDDGHIIRSER